MVGNSGIHVFLASPDALVPPDAAETVARSLDDADRLHIARFRFPHDRAIATASRMLQRLAIARVAHIRPSDLHSIRFSSSTGTRPALVEPASACMIDFSAANTDGLVACAVSCTARIGMDVEKLQPALPPGLLEYCCTHDEQVRLGELPDDLQRCAFFQLWTLKEAYLKARGIGLQVSPQLLGFHVEAPGGTPLLEVDAAIEANPRHWHFRMLDVGNAHAGSLCVHSEAQSPPPITLWRYSWSGKDFVPEREAGHPEQGSGLARKDGFLAFKAPANHP
jgi:4'-phosphopantetheinyl transferase